MTRLLENTCDCSGARLATSRPLGERSEPFLAAKRPTPSDEVARGSARHMKSDEGLFWSLVRSRRVCVCSYAISRNETPLGVHWLITRNYMTSLRHWTGSAFQSQKKKYTKNILVCKNAVTKAQYGSYMLLLIGSWLYICLSYPRIILK